ncbi:GspH/FimT family pseudopilin [Alishewanella jeotgali]|uniref:Type II secretion system protein H n=1 Tax=Alishewanella jeotgali KCTC 22429 TaxID=1129374 RepID=H3ZDF9_9ALTE|nr:GspH/FimT family pseudopilin [Alishewanella jeotgali]EHR41333.1 hypothetical protein AJE_06921 [Alishewanella jeotgali KCTC 22429]
MKSHNPTLFARHTAGFTLPELMTVLAIMAILAMVVTPGLTGFIQSNQATSAANMLLNQLQLTRSEAVKQSANVSLCPSTDQTNCADSINWQGYLLIRDSNKVISVVEIPTNLTIKASADVDKVSFNSVGAASQAITFNVQRQAHCFKVELQLNGRAEVRRGGCSDA